LTTPTASSLGSCRARFVLAAALLAFAPAAAYAQTVRVVSVLSLMAGLTGAPVQLHPAAAPVALLTPAYSSLALTPALVSASPAPMALIAAPATLTAPSPQRAVDGLRSIDRRIKDVPAPAQAGEWRVFFDGDHQVSRGVPVPAEQPANVRVPTLAPSVPVRTVQPALGLSVQPGPAPEAPAGWKSKIGSRAFWLAVAAIVPGGFLVLGAYWLYKLIAAYLRRRHGIPSPHFG
jgi:hypothetical protein